MTFLLILAVVIVAVIFAAINIFNNLVKLRELVKNGWSQIDVQLKRRHDLIPNLVETAKGYMEHESQTLENVIKARQQAIDASNIKDKQQAENFLSGTLKSLFAVSENYPNLKADAHMRGLMEELTTTENKIAFARQYYNDEVNRLNTSVQSFPNNIVAGLFNFTKEEFFEIEEPGERKAPEVKF